MNVSETKSPYDHGLRIKTPPYSFEDDETPRIYRKVDAGLQRARNCRNIGIVPLIYILTVLFICIFKLCMNIQINTGEGLLTMGMFTIIYYGQVILVGIYDASRTQKATVEDTM